MEQDDSHPNDAWSRLAVILLVWFGGSLLLYFTLVGLPDAQGAFIGWALVARPGWVWMTVGIWLGASWMLWALLWISVVSQPSTYRSVIAWALVLCGSLGSATPLIW